MADNEENKIEVKRVEELGDTSEIDASQTEVGHEVIEPPPPDVSELSRTTFEKLTAYLQGELTSTCEDYKLLEQMNRATLLKYAEMKQIAVNINTTVHDLNEKYKNLQPYLDQIDQIEENVANLEETAYKLDAYSKRLEAKYKQLEKK